MKYLRRFNENKAEDVKDFCELHLASLLDSKFYNLEINTSKKTNMIYITLKAGKQAFKWEDFRVDFIPFIEMLLIDGDYEMVPLGDKIVTINNKHLNKEELLSDELSFIKQGDWGNYIEDVKIVIR